MGLKGVERVSLVDYPGQICTSLFYSGCNLRCGFCHNPSLVFNADNLPTIDQEELLGQLYSRCKLVPAVCITGGEPTLDPGLPDLIRRLKELELLVKLDTNGTRPLLLARLLAANMVDYIALDVKAPKVKYGFVCGRDVVAKVTESIQLVKEKARNYEFRTTVVPGLLDKDDLIMIGQELAGADKYVLQQFRPSGPLLDPGLEGRQPYPEEFLHEVAAKLAVCFRTVEVRA
ncbi:MAG TPA: anaerobic ribonucleoside-triphosphate reductase activating protein [bacterium]|jgi:pyruvate formate lyase activating enzyme|nr:anaerobic ribonucleoside-triphosphate reductase activating protein [bacterium]